MNGVTAMHGQLNNEIYIVLWPSVMYISRKCPMINDVSDGYLWHCRLGYINKNRINILIREGILKDNDCESLLIYESCLLGKMSKPPFTEKSEWAIDVLDFVHTDVCGSMSTSARGGHQYFITFTNDLSKYGYVYLIKNKSESFEIFKQFCSEVEKQTKKSIKALRSDRRGEYLSDEFLTHLEENEILS